MKDAVQFFREVRLEAQKVTWPQKKEVTTTTAVVIVMVAILSVFMLCADFIISHSIQTILDFGK